MLPPQCKGFFPNPKDCIGGRLPAQVSCSGYSSVQEAALDFKAVVQQGLPVASIRYYHVNTKTVIRSWSRKEVAMSQA